MNLKFTDDEIKSVCRDLDILETAFDNDERNEIIHCWENANIVACPGSGKTTVLLAKLLLLAKRMPFEDGSGICVLTHTNVAIDEIKTKLGSKADVLFRHPNFFGTIQSFVNKFLALPYHKMCIGSDCVIISDSKYCNAVDKYLERCLSGKKNSIFTAVKHIFRVKERSRLMYNYRLDTNCNDERFLLISKVNGSNLEISKPRNKNQKNYTDYDEKTKSEIEDYLVCLKERIMIQGILHYDDCFVLAKRYLKKYNIDDLLSKRFSFLFVDEMQDTQKHQMDIIEKVFNDDVVKQYYGDPDQAIFSGIGGGETAWDTEQLKEEKGYKRLEISSSIRFGELISKCVNPFKNILEKNVIGNENVNSLKPYIILYDEEKDENGKPLITGVLEKFKELIDNHELQEENDFLYWKRKSEPFNAVGFIGKDNGNLTIHSYVDDYSKQTTKPKMHFNNLISYFQKRPEAEITKNGTSVYYELFINALIALLDEGNVKNDGHGFNHSKLKKYFIEKFEKEYYELRLKIYDLILEVEFNNKQANDVKSEFVEFFKATLQEQCFPAFNNRAFLNPFVESNQIEVSDEIKKSGNIKDIDGVKIKVGTIHSVKGETHMATLLLETYHNGQHNRNGTESECFASHFCGEVYNRASRVVHFRSDYVALSRPTHLLCVAMSKNRVKCFNYKGVADDKCPKYNTEECNWKIVEAYHFASQAM